MFLIYVDLIHFVLQFDPEVSSVVRIIPRACPPGQIFSPGADGSFVCTCDNDNPHITDCVPGTSQIILRVRLVHTVYTVNHSHCTNSNFVII